MSIYKLQRDELNAYRSIYDAIQHQKTSAVIPRLLDKDVFKIYKKALSESDFGYLYNQNQICTRTFGGSECTLEFTMCEEVNGNRIAVDMRVIPEIEAIIEKAKKQSTIRGAVQSVYEYFVQHFEYAHNEKENLKYHSGLSVFLYRKSVCEGFAMAFATVLNRLGVPCGIVNGESNHDGMQGGHAWNIVKIGNEIYHMDVTWDICLKNSKAMLFDYFLLDDKTIAKDHGWKDGSIPAARDAGLEMYYENGLCCTDRESVVRLVSDGFKRNQSEIGFRYTGKEYTKFFQTDNIKSVFRKAMDISKVGNCKIEYTTNKSTGTVRVAAVYC